MNKLLEKMLAILLVMTLAGANLALLGTYTYALSDNEFAAQNAKTQNANVEFDAYFEGGGHVKTEELTAQNAKLYLNIKVKNAGYLENGIVTFQNTNFKISKNFQNDFIQSIDLENNKIIFKQLNNGSDITIEVPIVILNAEKVDKDYFAKETKTVFTGKYIDGAGKEKQISKEIVNKLSWHGEVDVEVNGNLSVFAPYVIDGKYGVMVQSKINSKVLESKLPIENTQLSIAVPVINNMKPTQVYAIAKNTIATNGQTDGVGFGTDNYQYNAETGIVTITTKNEANTENKISWAKNTADEYLVTFLYEGKEIYDYINANGIDTNAKVNAKLKLYHDIETIKEKEIVVPMKTKEKVGTLTDFDIHLTSQVGKGYIYANYISDSKIETGYETSYIATIHSAPLVEKIEFAQKVDKFMTEDKKEGSTTVSGHNYTYNKSVSISEVVFLKMLGEEGKIEILNADGTVIGTITKDTPKDNQGNYILDISSANNNQLTIRTSKPMTEGQIVVKVNKAIKGNLDYSQEQMKAFIKLQSDLTGKTQTTTVNASTQMLLKEPKTVTSVSVSKPNLTTVVKNENVEIRAVLDTSSVYYALYKNPTLKIKLPSYISKVDLKSANILMDGGLKIKSAKVEQENGSFVINITLDGTQSEYTIDAEYQGAIIVLNTDLTVKTLTPSNDNKITMTYTNANPVATNVTGTVEAALNFVAPNGIVAANGISNYAEGKADLMSISDESITGTIATYAGKRTAQVYGKIINNYTNKINNIVVLGRIPVKDNKKIDSQDSLGSTFSTVLNSNLTLKGIDSSKYTVYYSEKVDATTDLGNSANGWSTTATTGAKSYMIVTKDYEMAAGETIDFSYQVEIPANLKHNENVYEMYKIYYNNVSSIGTIAETKTSSIIAMTTGQGPELKAEIKSTVDTVREGQIVKMKVTVTNTGKVATKNTKITVNAPKYTTFMDYVTGNGFYEEEGETKVLTLGTIEPGKSVEKSYYLKIDDDTTIILSGGGEGFGNDITHEEAEQIEQARKFPKEITHTATITADELSNGIPSNEYKMSIQKGDIAINMVSDIMESQVLKEGTIIEYTITLNNISLAGDLNNTEITIPLPNAVKYKSAVIKNNWEDETGTSEGVTYDQTNNTVKINIGALQIQKVIMLEVEVQKFEGSFSILAKTKAENTEEHYSNLTEYASEQVDLTVSELTSSPKYVKEADNVTYRFKITNQGKSTVTNIKVIDELPGELEFVKATYPYSGKDVIVTNLTDGKVVLSINQLAPGQSLDISIIARAKLLSDKNDKEVKNKVSVKANGFAQVETNTVINIVEYYEGAHQGGSENPKPSIDRYKITGIAWVDANRDGKRDTNEETLSGIPVILIYKDNNTIVKDPDTDEEKRTTTGSNGQYSFDNLPNGDYLVVFVYDSSHYSLTEYQAKGVNDDVNSDAIDINITLDGERKIAGITDVISIHNDNVRDIDIGLYSAEKFDLRLDKYVNKITLTTPTIGTKTYEYNNQQAAKIEVLNRNLGKSNIVIEYKIVVKNEGAVPGYVKKIVDYLPDGVGFNTELNKDWYLSENGNVYNSSLENEKINPGESKEVTLVVTKKITETSLGVLNNQAEIYETYNEQGLKDIDSTPGNKAEGEDDMSKADIVLSLVTGKIILYTSITLGVITILGFGIYMIKRKVIDRRL